MRRIIHNTTAIAACLSLLAPHLAQAQPAAPEGGAQPAQQAQPKPPQQEPAQQPQAGQPAAPAPQAAAPQAAPEPQAAPQAAAPEPQAAPQAAAPEPQAAQPEPAPKPQQPEAQQAAPEEPVAPQEPAAPEQAAQPQAERPAQAAREQQQERPAEAAREQQQERPAQAQGRAPDQEGKPARAEERAARQSAEEQATREGQAERPEAAARQQEQKRPEAAARQQEQTRPEQAAREQGQARPAQPKGERQADPAVPQGGAAGQGDAPTQGRAPQAAGTADPLRNALEAEQRSQEIPAPAAQGQGQGQAQGNKPPVAQRPAAGQPQAGGNTPDENELRDALARQQGQQGQQGQTPPAANGQPAPREAGQPAPGAAPAEANAPVTEAAQQAAQETRAAAAAALNEDTQGEVVEQQITEENSRSSSEDFATSLREALQPQQPQAEQRVEEDDDNDNDLAKALLLGLGAVAVGSYLNNNRQVALSAPDRVVVTRADGSQEVIKDEVALLRQPGSTVATENFDDGSSRTVVTRADGSRVVTIRDADLRVLRRTLVSPDGTQTRLIDDTAEVEPVDIATLPAPAPVDTTAVYQDEAALRDALRREVDIDRRFTLGQVRSIPEVRALVPPVNIDAITFDTGSAAITPDQARQLSTLGNVIQEAVAENPREVFLIEGHTDSVGADAANLALSDRRAESVALALSEYFQVPPENLIVQGYGEQFLQVRQEGDVRENRRAAVRRITDLLQTAEAQ